MADTGQHLQCSARNHRTRSLAVGLRWRHRVRLAQHDRHRLFQRGELLGRKACTIAGASRNTARMPGMARASLAWDIQGDSSGDAAAATRASIVRCRLLLAGRRRHLDVRCRSPAIAAGPVAHRLPAVRCSHRPRSRRPQALRIDMWAQHRISLHGRQCGTQVIGAQPGQKAAGQGQSVNAVVAWMIHRNHQIPGPRQRRAQPAHHARAAAVAMREQQGRQAITRDRRILADRPTSNSGASGGPMVSAVSRLPAGAGYQTVAQRVAVPCVAHGGAGQRRRAVALAGDAAFAGGADARERQQHSSQHSSGHAHLQLLVSGDVLRPAARFPRRPGRCARRTGRRSAPGPAHRQGSGWTQGDNDPATRTRSSGWPRCVRRARPPGSGAPGCPRVASAQARSAPCLPAVPRCSRSHHRHHCCSTRRS